MPILDWIGKAAVLRHHRQVPYRLLHCNGRLSAGDAESGNLLVHGDNLEALKALMPHYAGKVKCIYIDPPYNTGKEAWKYSDRVNSPQIQKWLGRVVGEEGEDMCRHDKWLCMMYPRLRLLRDFLRPDGVIFVSIDDNEQHHLRILMDDIFGGNNYLAHITWQGMDTVKNDARHFSSNSEFILCYAKRIESAKILGIPKTEKQRKVYKNYDNDPRGDYLLTPLHAKSGSADSNYVYTFPNGQKWSAPEGRHPSYTKENLDALVRDGRIYLDPAGKRIPQRKTYWSEVSDRMRPTTFWDYEKFGSTRQSNAELRELLGRGVFENPKPSRLIKIITDLVADKDSIILDSFAGSGTTAHAVLSLNKKDGGNRRFICVEMDDNICQNITAKRIAAVVKGRDGKQPIDALGGGFRYCTLGTPLFDDSGKIAAGVKFADLAAHIFFSETGNPIPKRASGKSPLIGVFGDKAICLLYNGVIGDKDPDGGNVLTGSTIKTLPKHKDGVRIVYAAGCRLGESRLLREGIVFKQLPYNIKTR